MPSIDNAIETDTLSFQQSSLDEIDAFWGNKPTKESPIPSLAIVADECIDELLASIASNPVAPLPITSICRIISRSDAKIFSKCPQIEKKQISYIYSVLSIVEAYLLAEGKIEINLIGPAACKRTLSYAWGKFSCNFNDDQMLNALVYNWTRVYEGINFDSVPRSFYKIIETVASVLGTCNQVSNDANLLSIEGRLLKALINADHNSLENIWNELSFGHGAIVNLSQFELLTREDKARYLQSTIDAAAKDYSNRSAIISCAYIATRIGLDSLEHFDLLNRIGNPEILFWYLAFAATQNPNRILLSLNSLGLRVLRDIEHKTKLFDRPISDISYLEFEILLGYGGIDGIPRKFGHIGEIEVEVLPTITSSFTLTSRNSKQKQESSTRQYELGVSVNTVNETRNAELNEIRNALETLNRIFLIQGNPTFASARKSKKKSY